MKYKRIIVIVMDSVGVGAAADAEKYGDLNTDTLGHIAERMNGIYLPNLQKIGLGNLHHIKGVDPIEKPLGYYQKLSEASSGKDTMTGHWEMMGLYIEKPFITFSDTGFPGELINELEKRTGYKVIGNKAASGTEIIKELGEEHLKTKNIIVYTSTDSVLQIAASEEVFGLKELYRCCEIARELTMRDEWKVGRVIARPFIGSDKDNFIRTSNRHDYALKPFKETVLNYLYNKGLDVVSVGKIVDIFDNEGITEYYRTKSNYDGMEKTIDLVRNKDFTGLLFVNLVDFDSLWGHRRNPEGYKNQLEEFDRQLGELMPFIREDDLLIITADHGNDPTHIGTDHTREHIPVLFYSPNFKGCGELKKGNTFANIGATVAENFSVELPKHGKSELKNLK